jgi:arylsulfatase A
MIRMGWMAAALLWLAACSAGPAADGSGRSAQAAPTPPNIILIFADDLGYGDLGSYGAQLIRTPNLDRLARQGVRATSYYSAANVCTPSRASLLTGRYAIRSGMQNVLFPTSTIGLPQSEVTLAEALKARGYVTAMMGKWHLGSRPEFWPTTHGFDTFLGVPYSNDMTPFPLYRGSEVLEPEADQSRLTERFTDEAIRVLETAGDKPAFIYLAHTFPHIPLYASPAHKGKSEAGLYGDTVEEIDANVGRLLDALKRTGKDRNTLILFTSDNGPWFEGSPGPWRDRKGGTNEGAYRVPFIAWAPGMLPAGKVVDQPLSGLDVFPTLVRLAGGANPPGVAIDGVDIWPALTGKGPVPERDLLFFDVDRIAAIRSGKWRLLVGTFYRNFVVNFGAAGRHPLLFDMEKDPQETYNLSDLHPDVMKDLLGRISAAQKVYGAVDPLAPRASAASPTPQ